MTAPRLFLTRREAAEACGVSEDTIRRAKDRGLLKAKKTGNAGGGKELYRIADLEAWFDSLADA
jgi:DNA-binding transcriptional MerR regulator